MFYLRSFLEFLILLNCSLALAQTPTVEDDFWSAISRHEYKDAARAIEALLAQDPRDPQYIFQKAELLWAADSPYSAVQWLSQEESSLDKNEIINFLNKMFTRFTENDWKGFNAFLLKRAVGPDLSFTEVKFLTLGLSFRGSRRQLVLIKDRVFKNFDQYPETLRSDLAALIDKFKLTGQTSEVIEQGLKKDPDSPKFLMLKAQILDSRGDYLEAIKLYDRVLAIAPSNQAAFNLKMYALMDLGASSLALEEMSRNPKSDPVLIRRARGNLAMMYIRWEEPAQAIAAMEIKKEKQQEDYALGRDHKVRIDVKAAKIEENRSRWDSILVLRQKEEFDKVIAAYEQALREGVDVPAWILRAVADSYLAKRQPDKALDLYRTILKNDPDYFEVKISFYYTLVDLGRYQEAGDLLEAMDRAEPVRIKDRGIMRDNPRKEEIAYNKVWLLMYQDRLKKAQKISDRYVNAAPADTQLLSAHAHLYLWRGWPRHALEQFLIIHTMDPAFVTANTGYALTLYENMHQAQGRAMLKSLSEQYPNDLNITHARRQMAVDDMATFTVSGYYEHQIIGDDEFYLSERLDLPVNDHNQLFAELIRRNTEFISTGGGHYLTNRFYLGDVYRPDNTWKLTDALTGDYNTGQRIGGISEVEYTPDDYWTGTFHYDSRTIDIPLVSRAPGTINVQDYSLSSLFRQSESFNSGVSVDLKNYEDGNAHWDYGWTTDTAVKTYAYWKWRIGTNFDYNTFSKQDVDYYSPKKLYDAYLVPNVEHTWYKLYDRSVTDHFYVGVGQQWERGFGDENVGYLRYEIEDKLSDTLSVLVGEIYSLEFYTGQHMNVLNTYWTIRRKF